MNIADALEHMKAARDRQARLFTDKNHDYAGNAEALANGKSLAAVVEAIGIGPLMTTPAGFYLCRALEKVHRAVNIINSGGKTRCEPLIDTMDDLANFAALAYLAMIDEGHIPAEQEKKNE